MAIFTAITGAIAASLVGIGLPAALAGIAANVVVGAAVAGQTSQMTRTKP